ncbi:radical SAM/SPASM domain-containing protein [Bdellovibrio reynosensis]|uniref:Radical SAM protein n=1 Tax=Bdellovibrio reynosensis TaxID=2835041 RepID=A0ABY4C7W5_9BACT|nr:radical SAM protein [Bdellovibrio reynosensis]UOF00002.1 radical SAM protein [Bdellovibrio reynosensis]
MRLTRYSLSQVIFDQNLHTYVALLLNTKTGIQISLDLESYKELQAGSFESLAPEVLSNLERYQFLTSETPDQELLKIISENQVEDNKEETLYVVLQPSSWCQLGCVYCGQAHSKEGKLDKDAILSFIQNKIQTHQPKELVVSWFGAEPLTAVSRIVEIGKELKSLCLEKGIRFRSKATTNGVNLNRKNMDLLIEHANCNQYEITLDGTAEFHDQRRFTKYKGPSFDVIYKNLKDLLSEEKPTAKFIIRCNVDNENREGVLPLIKKLHSDGLHKKIWHFYMIPVHSWGNDAHTRSSSLKEFADWELGILMEMIQLGFPSNLIPKRKKQLCLASSKSGYLVDPSGEVFGCTEVSLVPSYEVAGKNIHSLGNIKDEGAGIIPNLNKFSHFYDEVIAGDYGCKECFLLPLCGGRCPKEWAEGRAACPSLKMNIQERMLLQYLQSKKYFPKKEAAV